ncbi:MarR family winged helix-turn-helix transcriptional regulator [Phytoactinopolyspora mesophila]|uniref:MarR family transcriptional regulator n=1 Tax=Phytoactinopolyspora mesophila TaxID=2650750 RepID=A0A7K3M0L7_9ACTN|nr:MarR family winged helix-turn-helix transcriptional regulator [Phytoactinopolyspora mesophila]NDL56836.1 MarR family transcriptional regulator [Phytoactinopolyspora mesophila]
MPDPSGKPPIAKVLWGATHDIARAFDEALGLAGGSRAIWFIMLSLKSRTVANQRELAAEVGIQGATLTHHLSAMEQDGLIVRRRDPDNRRVHLVELTEEGETAFLHLRDVALTFDRQLRRGIPDTEIAQLRETLAKLRDNAAPEVPAHECPESP